MQNSKECISISKWYLKSILFMKKICEIKRTRKEQQETFKLSSEKNRMQF